MTIEEVIFKWDAWVTSQEIYIQDANPWSSRLDAMQCEVDLVKEVLADLKQAKPQDICSYTYR